MASVMNAANVLRTALNTGKGVSFGAWQTMPGSHLSRAMARCGFDWIVLDCEHGNLAGKKVSVSIKSKLKSVARP
jgi:4-hydroxy-2-oxoheptanedioate aldolase